MSQESIWVSWEDHRRSRELSNALGVDFYPLISESPRWKRYPVLLFKTIILLLKKRPTTVFVQNPSIVLTSAVVFLKGIFRYIVIVDRHSNFKFEHESSKSLKWRLFHFLSRYTLKNADLTVVTNEHLRQICEEIGGRSVVLQDRIPSMENVSQESVLSFFENDDKIFQIMVVTTFNEDEPIDEIVEAAKKLPKHFRLYLTGNYHKKYSEYEKKSLMSSGVVLTGFISENDYQTLMYRADAVVVLTKKEFILNCGAYEAIALGKPMILSNTDTIREYFDFGAIYSECRSEDILDSIISIEANTVSLKEQLEAGKEKIGHDWRNRFCDFERVLQDLRFQD